MNDQTNILAPTQTVVLNALGETCLTVAEIAAASDLGNRQVVDAVRLLIRRGLAERVERGCFRLTEAGGQAQIDGIEIIPGPQGPLDGPRLPTMDTLRQRCWNVMRIRKRFALPDLLMCAANDHDRNPEEAIPRYLCALNKGGYLFRTRKWAQGRRPNSRHPVYVLRRDTGPVSPSLIRRESVIFDYNTDEEFPL